MADLIDQAARQVRSLTPGQRVIHRLLASVNTKDDGGRAYRTACHRDLPTQKAVLTTVDVDCGDCLFVEAGQ